MEISARMCFSLLTVQKIFNGLTVCYLRVILIATIQHSSKRNYSTYLLSKHIDTEEIWQLNKAWKIQEKKK